MHQLIVKKFDIHRGLTRDDVQEIIDAFPYTAEETLLLPFGASVQKDNGQTFNLFGFADPAAFRAVINEENLDAFNAMVLQEADQKMPPKATRLINPFGLSTMIIF